MSVFIWYFASIGGVLLTLITLHIGFTLYYRHIPSVTVLTGFDTTLNLSWKKKLNLTLSVNYPSFFRNRLAYSPVINWSPEMLNFFPNKYVLKAIYQTLNTITTTKIVRLKCFQKSHLQSVSIFFKFVHPCLLSKFLLFIPSFRLSSSYRYVWQFSLFEFWYISWHRSFKLIKNRNTLCLNL